MCKFNEAMIEEEFIGYKVAAKMDDGYYSIAMGFSYPQNGDVPIPKEQKKLSSHFSDYILIYAERGYVSKMEGRTAAFVNLRDAIILKSEIDQDNSYDYNASDFLKYKVAILKIKLTKNLLVGTYNSRGVVGGKHMEILEEVEVKEKQ